MPAPASAVLRAIRPPEVELEEYPYSDGRVLMESEPHANSIVAMRNQLQWHFEARRDVYVSGSMAVYYRQGDPGAVVAPDLFVVLGAAKRVRRSYRTWDEGGVVPAFVVEVASLSTSRRDATGKKATYEGMGVREYWRFDPTGRRIAQGLVGWRLAGGLYGRVRQAAEAGWHRSEVLGLELRAEGWLLRFRDPILGRDLLTHSESQRKAGAEAAARKRAERKAEAEVAARRRVERKAEAEVAARERVERKAEAEAAARERAECERDVAQRNLDEANRRIRELEAKLRLRG